MAVELMNRLFSKLQSSLAACLWLSSFKKSHISLQKVSEAIVLSVAILSFISVKRLSVSPLYLFLLAGVGTFFLFPFDAPSEGFEEESWLASSSETSSSWLSLGLAYLPLVSGAVIPGSVACWSCESSIELIIGYNLPNQLPNFLSSLKRLIVFDVFTFTTPFLQILMERLNFCRVCAMLKGNSSPLLLHLSFNFSITLS